MEIVSEAEQKVNINIVFFEILNIDQRICNSAVERLMIDGCTLMALLVTQISGLIKVLFCIPV